MGAIQQVLMAVGTSVFLPPVIASELQTAVIASGIGYNDASASASIDLRLSTSGSLSLEYSASGTSKDPGFPVSENWTWLVGGTASLYSVRMRKTSGSPFGPSAVNAWIPITADLQWRIDSASNSSQTSEIQAVTAVLEIAFTNNLANILAQSSINFQTSAETESGFIP